VATAEAAAVRNWVTTAPCRVATHSPVSIFIATIVERWRAWSLSGLSISSL
jgi:hypothetical protein